MRPQWLNRQRSVRLGDLAHTRSGDKGNRSNIGVVAHDDAAYALARSSSDRVGCRRVPASPSGSARSGAIELPRSARVQFRDRACPGRRREPFAPARHAGQGAGRLLLELPLAGPRASSGILDPEVTTHEHELLVTRAIDGPSRSSPSIAPSGATRLSRALLARTPRRARPSRSTTKVRVVVLTAPARPSARAWT